MFGCRAEDLAGRVSLAELAVEADRTALADGLRRCSSGEDRSCRLEFTGPRRDGTLVVVELRAVALRPPGMVAVVLLDVTERTLAARTRSLPPTRRR